MECGGSAVECRTRNRESPGSNPLYYRFEAWASLLSPRRPSSLSCINGHMAIDSGGNVSGLSLSVVAAWPECFPQKSRWCRNEQICQGAKCKAF